ncbi:MAG TPA: cobalamin-binding protein [Clostridia bacterium]|nr:cobalamin-binding protein [Clostridia bacterium]
MTVVDDAGRRVEISGRPSRIISLAPSNTEILYALGQGPKVVGVTSFCNYPPEAREVEKIGDLVPNVEKILTLDPDLVIGIKGHEEVADRLVQAGIPVLLLDPKNFAQVLEDIRLVSRVVGSPERGEALCEEMSREVEAVRKEVAGSGAGVGKRPSLFVLLDVEGLWTAGPGTFIDELVTMAGGENIAEDAKEQYVQYSVETLISKDPDAIVLTGPNKKDLYDKTALTGLRAIKENKVFEVNPDLVSRPGPRLVEGLKEFARVVESIE